MSASNQGSPSCTCPERSGYRLAILQEAQAVRARTMPDADTAKCNGNSANGLCERRNLCLRYVVAAAPWQSYNMFEGGERCSGFTPLRKGEA